MAQGQKVRNEWVKHYVATGEFVDEIPEELKDEVKARAETKKPKVQVAEKPVKEPRVSIR